MNITNRRFVYPVLSENTSDYKKSVFQVDFTNKMESVDSLKLSFDIKMTCQEIKNLIINGQAEYVIHLECSSTAYRKVLSGMTNILMEQQKKTTGACLVVMRNIVPFLKHYKY